MSSRPHRDSRRDRRTWQRHAPNDFHKPRIGRRCGVPVARLVVRQRARSAARRQPVVDREIDRAAGTYSGNDCTGARSPAGSPSSSRRRRSAPRRAASRIGHALIHGAGSGVGLRQDHRRMRARRSGDRFELLTRDVVIVGGGFNSCRMHLLHSLLSKLGLRNNSIQRNPIRVFLLDDDTRRHKWFAVRFRGDAIHMAKNVEQAQKLLSEHSYDAIFLDHDLHPEHYSSFDHDDERTGYAVAVWLAEIRICNRSHNSCSHKKCDGQCACVIDEAAGRSPSMCLSRSSPKESAYGSASS